MSAWAHIAAVFRVDALGDESLYGTSINGRRRPEWDKVTGRAIYEPIDVLTDNSYEKQRERRDWADYYASRKAFMPTGSEGSLQRLVWVNPNRTCSARYTVTCFGDLRDYDSFDDIEAWFEQVCDRCVIRQAVCHVTIGDDTRTFERSWS